MYAWIFHFFKEGSLAVGCLKYCFVYDLLSWNVLYLGEEASTLIGFLEWLTLKWGVVRLFCSFLFIFSLAACISPVYCVASLYVLFAYKKKKSSFSYGGLFLLYGTGLSFDYDLISWNKELLFLLNEIFLLSIIEIFFCIAEILIGGKSICLSLKDKMVTNIILYIDEVYNVRKTKSIMI